MNRRNLIATTAAAVAMGVVRAPAFGHQARRRVPTSQPSTPTDSIPPAFALPASAWCP